MLSFLNRTREADMRQIRGFHNTVSLLRNEERSQLLDMLWVSREDRNYDESQPSF